MGKGSKTKKRIRAAAITGTAVALCAGMIFGVQARRNILNSTKPYAAKDEFKILEIVPSHDGHENEEIGYFVGDSTTDRADFMNVSKAKSLGGRSSSTVVGSDEYKQEMENLLNMRKYGLIKYEGVDRGAYNVDVSEYPVYSKNANFIKNRADGYVAMGNEYSRGTFAMSADNSGGYFLKDGYEIDSDGTIYKLKTETVSVNSVTVSENGVSSNTVTYVEQVVHDYAVPEGDADNQQLPEGLEVHYDDGLQLYTGNVAFEESETGKYYGYALSDYYVRETASADNDFYNGEWFKEFVLGNRESTKSVDVKTVKASSVTAAMLTDTDGKEAYDLIYISGTYDDYNAAGEDFDQDVVVKLFNLATHPDYQAVIMDYALLGPSSGVNPTNIEKLALMLWQTDQGALIDSNKTLFVADANLNVTTLPAASNVVWSEFGSYMNDEVSGVGNGTFVCGSTYVYRHVRSYFNEAKSQIDAEDFFANGDFASEYTTAVVESSFVDVRAYLQMNNLNYEDRVAELVTPALIIQYILAYDGTTPSLIKADLKVLEIQPVRAFLYNTYCGSVPYSDCDTTVKANRDTFIKKYLDDRFKESQGAVSFTSMTIEEFIGRNEDLNETYDMIYIGSNYTHKLNGTSYTYYFTNTNPNFKTMYNNGSTQAISGFTGYTRTFTVNKSAGTITAKQTTGTITDFQDNYMDGMVYYNIGDRYYIGTGQNNNGLDSLLGIINDGTTYGNKTQKSLARFSGRDLTEDKKQQMMDYLSTGYPVIVAGDIMRTVTDSANKNVRTINPTTYSTATADLNKNGYDHGRVDNSSKLYELLQYAIDGLEVKDGSGNVTGVMGGNIKNLVSEADVDAGVVTKTELADYLNKPKLTLNLTGRPVEYSYTTRNVSMGGVSEPVVGTQAKLAPDSVTGKYYMDYEFTITNAATLYSGSDSYGVHLYVDINADGKFSESEELADCTVTNAVTGGDVSYSSSLNGRIYSLQTNVLYKLRREVPEGFAGILPWSLEVVMNGNRSIRASEIGYTMVPRQTDDKIKINILQISRGISTYNVNTGKITCNIEYEMANYTTKSTYYMGAYLSNLDDYEVKVKTITQKDYEDNYTNKLDDYDMLILGFADCYDAFSNPSKVQPLINYINSGRPVLLTHDLIMFRAPDTQTSMLRNIAGMDRYGCLDTSVAYGGTALLRNTAVYTRSGNPNQMNIIEKSGYRVIYQPGRAKEATDYQTQGLTNLTMVRYGYGSGATNYNGTTATYTTRSYINWPTIRDMARSNWDDQQPYTVHNINEGQITTYPYILPDSFPVGKTHNQYYQLNMEADLDEDGETDIVVWYTLGNQQNQANHYTGGGSRYWATPNDVINNYYIYNKGNITYSGVGHSTPASNSSQKYEAQLFVNTMIAAYRAGIRVPSVRMFDTDRTDAQESNSMVIAYDKNVGTNSDIGDAQSSALKDAEGNFLNRFVDTGDDATRLYFQINDPNFVKGTKNIEAKFYIANPSGDDTVTVDGETISVTEVPLTVYSSDFTQTFDATELKSGVRYGIYLPLSQLKDKAEIKLYVSAKTTITNISVSNSKVVQESPVGVAEYTIRKMDMLKLD